MLDVFGASRALLHALSAPAQRSAATEGSWGIPVRLRSPPAGSRSTLGLVADTRNGSRGDCAQRGDTRRRWAGCQDGSTPRPPSPGRTSRSGGYHCPTADRSIAAARLHCCLSATLHRLAVGATRLRLADAGGAGAGKCLRGSAQHAYVVGRALRRLLSDPDRAICSADRRFDGRSLRPISR